MAASENLSVATILIFRRSGRYFGSSSLSLLYKIGVVKTVLGKNPPGKSPPDSKLNPIPNLTLTQPVNPRAGRFTGGGGGVPDTLKTSTKFIGKQICWRLFSVKLQTFSLKFY